MSAPKVQIVLMNGMSNIGKHLPSPADRYIIRAKVREQRPLEIINHGQAIAATNFWQSNTAAYGLFFLSWNEGAGRLLCPDAQIAALKEMRTGKYVIVSRGPKTGLFGSNGGIGLELLFEDESDRPFSIQIGASQTDKMIRSGGQGFDIVVWTREGEQLRLPGRFRTVSEIPCLQPWEGA